MPYYILQPQEHSVYIAVPEVTSPQACAEPLAVQHIPMLLQYVLWYKATRLSSCAAVACGPTGKASPSACAAVDSLPAKSEAFQLKQSTQNSRGPEPSTCSGRQLDNTTSSNITGIDSFCSKARCLKVKCAILCNHLNGCRGLEMGI